ncbi:MAG TPA: ABC transporter ATP-binding protein [Streptosporangiaceae bacterium]
MTAAAAAPAGAGPAATAPALRVTGLDVRYGPVHAVRSASLTVPAGQVVALIGETGSGKSSLALAAARLLPSSAVVTGQVSIAGTEVSGLGGPQFRRARARLLGCIAQDAMAALNPVVPVGRQVGELFAVHAGLGRSGAAEAAVAALAQVEIRNPAAVARLYPHQLSGGMRQRVMIAMAMALGPPLIIADEPTTALDVSTQAEILGLIGDLRERSNSGFLWITHDMGVVAELADWAAVMYAGRIVEQGTVGAIFDAPAHPYTQGLLQTRRDLRSGAIGAPLFQIPGSPPAPGVRPAGCPFRPRCLRATGICEAEDPPLTPAGDPEHAAACHHPGPGS